MASLKHLIAAGPARILGPIYAESFIKVNGTDSQILLANGSTLAKSDIVSYIQTVASSTTGAYEIGKITINGTQTTIYGKDTTGGGGASQLNDLSDVTLSTPANGQVLKYNGTKWVNSALSISDQYVSQKADTGSEFRKLLATAEKVNTSGDDITDDITDTYYSNIIEMLPSDGALIANKFITRSGANNQVVAGDGALRNAVTIYSGTGAPGINTGSNGDIYIQVQTS